MIKYIFFDVSGTLLTKPVLYHKIQEALEQFGFLVPLNELKFKHKLLSEIIHFPDQTNKEFYKNFNAELLRTLGILPDDALLEEIFTKCTYLPWEKFEDTEILKQLNIPIGIISNFNITLREKIEHFFGKIFANILVSEELGIAKPNIEFYQKALQTIEYKAKEVLYIGDSIKLDIEPATKIGLKTLLIDRDNFYCSSKYKITNLAEITNHL
ncbi:MAG: HAD-IA family hydrolase [Bacteroidetes bacterium]|nr:HAD-IA family hydrolase [Bacteroidota bacterium]HNJ59047.1 HAD-IA family hydrolase [Chitinophagaceae bacterium]